MLTPDLYFEWVDDPEPYESDIDETPSEVLGCVCRDRGPKGEVLASLWGIADPSYSYAQEIQAELAAEVAVTHYSARWQ